MFDSPPSKLGKSQSPTKAKKRPATAAPASSGYASPIKKPTKKGPQVKSLVDLVKKADRCTCEEVIGYLKEFLETQARLEDPLDDIE
mgnify:CR=1 FL=1